MSFTTVGLDIGGATLKLATSDGVAVSERFSLWQRPDELADRLRSLLIPYRTIPLAITMTGELCDCFDSKDHGVRHILDAVEAVPRDSTIAVWQTGRGFVSIESARRDAWATGASNWHALATWAAHLAEGRHVLLVDTGSTTTDVIPIRNGRPVAIGASDPDRLASGELLYFGVERTPICAVLPEAIIDGVRYSLMAELFATTRDAGLMLGMLEEETTDLGTADGKPATRHYAIARLARMIGSDPSRFGPSQAEQLAQQTIQSLTERIARACRQVCDQSLDGDLRLVILAGQGEWLIDKALRDDQPMSVARRISLSTILGPQVSQAACAYAVSRLLADRIASGQ